MKTVSQQQGFYNIVTDNAIERIAGHRKKIYFQKLWIYPASGQNAGKLVVNGASVFIGKHGDGPDITPDELGTGDTPIKIELPINQQMAIEDILIQGKAGDGVFYSFT